MRENLFDTVGARAPYAAIFWRAVCERHAKKYASTPSAGGSPPQHPPKDFAKKESKKIKIFEKKVKKLA